MNERSGTAKLRRVDHPFADEVLDRLDVVVDAALDRLDPQRVIEREVARNGVQSPLSVGRERLQGVELRPIRECSQLGDLHPDPVSNRGQRREVHRPRCYSLRPCRASYAACCSGVASCWCMDFHSE